MSKPIPFSPTRRRRIRGENYELVIETSGHGMDGTFRVFGSEIIPAMLSAQAALGTIDDLTQEDADMIVNFIKHGIATLGPRCAGVNLDRMEDSEPLKMLEIAKRRIEHKKEE